MTNSTYFNRRNKSVDGGWMPVLQKLGLLSTWVVLERFSDHSGVTFPSPKKIAELTGCSVRSVMRHLKKLRDFGLIEQAQKPSPGLCAKWRMLDPKQVTPSMSPVERPIPRTHDTNDVTRTGDTEGGVQVTRNGGTGDIGGGVRVTPACHAEGIINGFEEVEHTPLPPVSSQAKPPRFTRDQVEGIYVLYPRKVGKAKAIRQIERALVQLHQRHETDPVAFLVDRVTAFAASEAGQQGQYTPHPATWFFQGRYDDDPAEWNRSDRKPTQHRATSHAADISKPAPKTEVFQ